MKSPVPSEATARLEFLGVTDFSPSGLRRIKNAANAMCDLMRAKSAPDAPVLEILEDYAHWAEIALIDLEIAEDEEYAEAMEHMAYAEVGGYYDQPGRNGE